MQQIAAAFLSDALTSSKLVRKPSTLTPIGLFVCWHRAPVPNRTPEQVMHGVRLSFYQPDLDVRELRGDDFDQMNPVPRIAPAEKVARPKFAHCGEMQCEFGAVCRLVGQAAQCHCERKLVCGRAQHLPGDRPDLQPDLQSDLQPDLQPDLQLDGRSTSVDASVEQRPEPLCGSNGQTYAGDCELGRQACLVQTNITIVSHRVC